MDEASWVDVRCHRTIHRHTEREGGRSQWARERGREGVRERGREGVSGRVRERRSQWGRERGREGVSKNVCMGEGYYT